MTLAGRVLRAATCSSPSSEGEQERVRTAFDSDHPDPGVHAGPKYRTRPLKIRSVPTLRSTSEPWPWPRPMHPSSMAGTSGPFAPGRRRFITHPAWTSDGWRGSEAVDRRTLPLTCGCQLGRHRADPPATFLSTLCLILRRARKHEPSDLRADRLDRHAASYTHDSIADPSVDPGPELASPGSARPARTQRRSAGDPCSRGRGRAGDPAEQAAPHGLRADDLVPRPGS